MVSPHQIIAVTRNVLGVSNMALYMVLERFRNADAVPVYRRFRERGRLAPDGLNYISSWVTEDMSICYQVMETADRALLDEWLMSGDALLARMQAARPVLDRLSAQHQP